MQFVEPVFDCVAGKQSRQVVEPIAEVNVPAKQSMQSGWPGKSWNRPGAHDVQVEDFFKEDKPTSHSVHVFPSPIFPAGHSMQSDCPVVGCDVPGRHNVQAAAPVDEYEPIAHSVHVFPLPILPLAHGSHLKPVGSRLFNSQPRLHSDTVTPRYAFKVVMPTTAANVML